MPGPETELCRRNIPEVAAGGKEGHRNASPTCQVPCVRFRNHPCDAGGEAGGFSVSVSRVGERRRLGGVVLDLDLAFVSFP